MLSCCAVLCIDMELLACVHRAHETDIAAANPTIVKELQEIIAGYAASEVSIEASGLCPTQYGTGNDPRCAEAAAKITPPFWVPWLKDGEE